MVSTSQAFTQAEMALRSQVMVPKRRTGYSEEAGDTATAWIVSPISMPAAWGLMMESGSTFFFLGFGVGFFTFAITDSFRKAKAPLPEDIAKFYSSIRSLATNLKT